MVVHPAGVGMGVRTSRALPTPGSPSRNMPGLVTSPARSQASGSRQTTEPCSWSRPTGVPTVGAPAPVTNGLRPQAWMVVAWNSAPGTTFATRPACGSL